MRLLLRGRFAVVDNLLRIGVGESTELKSGLHYIRSQPVSKAALRGLFFCILNIAEDNMLDDMPGGFVAATG